MPTKDDEEYTQVRCPGEFSKLFMMIKNAGLPVKFSKEENAYEFACSDCAREERRAGRKLKRVIHMYYLDGSFAGTAVEE